MPTWATADLPAVPARCRAGPEQRRLSEVLLRLPDGGEHWWIRTRRRALGTRQAVAAIARAAGVEPSRVAAAGSRDRSVTVEQWFSVAKDDCDQPGRLRNAGCQGKLTVLEVREGRKPVSREQVVALAWELHLDCPDPGLAYRRAKPIVDRLRVGGLPNRVPLDSLGGLGAVRRGRLLAQGRRLPARAVSSARHGDPLRLQRALQASLFNTYLDRRVAAGALSEVLTGGLCWIHCNLPPHRWDLLAVDDPAAMQARVDSWEAIPTGPMFGRDMPSCTAAAAAFEAELLAEAGLVNAADIGLPGARRALCAKPAQIEADLDRSGLRVTLRLPVETSIEALLGELLHPGEDEDIDQGED